MRTFRKALAKEPGDSVARSQLDWTLSYLATTLHREGRLSEAETFQREAVAKAREIWGVWHPDTGAFISGLATLFRAQGKFSEFNILCSELIDSDTAEGLNRVAWWVARSADAQARNGAMAIRCAEAAVSKTGRTNAAYLDTLAAAYAEVGQFTNAVKAQQQAIALLKIDTMREDCRSRLNLYLQGIAYHDDRELADRATTFLHERKPAEAEPLARECLVLREKLIPDNWLTFNARSLLGGSLLGQKKYAEAEPLLLSGYEGMKEREDQIPAAGKPRLTEALQRLVQLYQATGQSGKAAQWRQKLTQTDKSEASKQDGRQLKSN